MIAKVQTSKICAQKMHFTIVGINLHFLFVLTETKLDVGENLVVLGWFLPWRIVVFFRADSWALDNWAHLSGAQYINSHWICCWQIRLRIDSC